MCYVHYVCYVHYGHYGHYGHYVHYRHYVTGITLQAYIQAYTMHLTTMKAIPITKENTAVQLLACGQSVRKVSAQLGISSATVGHISKKHLPEHIGLKPGCPQLLSDTDK
jgi:hypothetical protein